MKILNREEVKRIVGQQPVAAGGGGGGDFDPTVLNGYATELWVDENYISIEFFSRLFQAHGTENGVQTDIDPNDMDSTITSIESMFGFWTDYYLSALGNGGGLGSTLYLSTLADVLISSPANNQVLTYNATIGKWVNANTQAGVTDLASLTDVSLTSPQNGQTLLYDGLTSKWYNSDLKTINGQSLLGSGDISVGGGASGNYLPLSGGTMSGWVDFNACGVLSSQQYEYRPTASDLGHLNRAHTFSIAYLSGTPRFGCTIFATNDGNTYFQSGRYDGFVNEAYHLIFQEIAGYVGIGTRTPTHKLHVEGESASEIHYFNRNNTNIGYIGLISNDNNKIGVSNLLNDDFIIWGSGNVGISTITPAYKLQVIGESCSARHYFYTYDRIGYVGTTNDDGNILAIYNFKNGPIYLNGSGVGIGVNYPSYALHVAGDIYATGAVTALSDIRRKDVLSTDIGLTVEQIADAPTIKFLWKDKREEGTQVGSVAQFWAANLPEVVMDKGGELSMQYGVAALVSAIITARKVVDHERRISELEKENERLKTEVEQLRLN